MNKILALLVLLFAGNAFAQAPEFSLQEALVESQIRFLASDVLQGRRTGEAGNNIAARYIAEEFRQLGLKSSKGLDGYFQNIDFVKHQTPETGSLVWGENTFNHLNNMIILSGEAMDQEAKAIFVGYGLEDEEKGWDDYKGKNVEGKIVVTMGGIPDSKDPMETFSSMKSKIKAAKSHGAIALIELYRLPFPWKFFKKFMASDRLTTPDPELDDNSPFTYAWLKENDQDASLELKKKKIKMRLQHPGVSESIVKSQNVVGILNGTDPDLADEYLLLSAHYDHVGTGQNGGSFYTPEDSIFNGARDNAMGTVALLSAAKTLSELPTRRPVIFVAFTGEEVGLLGSQYYAQNPIIPLEQTIFNFNTDGAGYNDKSSVSLIGWDRTGTNEAIEKGAAAFDLKVIKDPAPEQGLFDRSDNVSFAVVGVPCASLSPGVTGFDEELMKYYHQVADNPETVDMAYLLKYVKAFCHTSRIIADDDQKPKWKSGDKYEKAGNKLYNLK